jgi:ribosomal protein S18 acetylase RimI-like enzyme
MAPITSNLKRRSIPTSEDQPSKKRAKLTAKAPRVRINRRTVRDAAAESIAKANSLGSATFTTTYIPEAKQTFTTQDGERKYTCTFRRTQDLDPQEMEACFRIVEQTSKADYESHAEEGWNEDYKRAEMCEDDMRFILVRQRQHGEKDEGSGSGTQSEKDKDSRSDTPAKNPDDLDDAIVGFTSIKLELDPDNEIPQVYIYEIHLKPSVRGLGLGKHLMSLNECIAKNVGLEKSILTVFTCNESAEKMYRGMGYVDDECCPKTRKLRGKIVRPKYLILSKAL